MDLDLWKTFKEHRQRLKAPMTQDAENLNITKLEKLIKANGANQEKIIGQSIELGWKGLFPLKEEFKTVAQQRKITDPIKEAEEKWMNKPKR